MKQLISLKNICRIYRNGDQELQVLKNINLEAVSYTHLHNFPYLLNAWSESFGHLYRLPTCFHPAHPKNASTVLKV